jgi:hypothetical protein
MIKECQNCHAQRLHHARGLCYNCYKKINWKPKSAVCKRCQKEKIIHAKELCASCYNYVFHLDKNKAYYQRKANNVDLKTFRKVTRACAICGFEKIVDLLHLDANKANNSPKNLLGLCPNHHRLLTNLAFRQETLLELSKKGFDMPQNERFNYKNRPFSPPSEGP